MATFVLVGGAWIGGWAWREVASRLRTDGHDVYPATLTGLGDRRHLARPEINLEAHITDIVSLIEGEGLSDVALVGHSYAGIVVRGVADRVPDRLADLIYLDSAPVEDGEAWLSLSPPEVQEATRATVAEQGEGWRLPFPAMDGLEQQASLRGLDEAARRLMTERAVAQPFGTFTQPLRLTGPTAEEAGYRRAVVACDDMRTLVGTGMPRFQVFTPPEWRWVDLETGHWPMLSIPEQTADALEEAVGP